MNSKQRRRRRRRKVEPMSLPTMLLLFLLILLIPLLCYWYGVKYVEQNVPDHATGYIVEVAPGTDDQ